MPSKLEALLKETKAWCAQKHGRQAQLARALGVHRYTVNLWLRGKQKPTAESVLQLEAFMKGRKNTEPK
jgi:transcriptional regulator with XRE-family HTH domain